MVTFNKLADERRGMLAARFKELDQMLIDKKIDSATYLALRESAKKDGVGFLQLMPSKAGVLDFLGEETPTVVIQKK